MPDPIVDLPGEIWKPVVGFEGLYEVSSAGRVATLTRRNRPLREGAPKSCRRLLKLNPTGGPHKEYRAVTLVDLASRRRRVSVHVLVLEAFVGPRPEDMECCHNNGIPSDNRLENLRWDTRSNNMADKLRHGTARIGGRHPMAVLTAQDVREIRRLVAAGKTSRQVAEVFGVTVGAIKDIRSRKNWRHVK